MYRVLIASADEPFAQRLHQQLQEKFYVEACGSGKWALELLNSFSPDIVVLDNKITELDCLAVIQAIRASGKLIHIVIISSYFSPYVERQLAGLGVDIAITKPCKISAVAEHICGIAQMIADKTAYWDVEQILDNLLMELGFRLGPDRYRQIRESILLRYEDSGNLLMKQIYVEVGMKCGSNGRGVEKAVRDAIQAAWATGDRELWNLMFTYSSKEECNKPSNEEFIGRIVLFLRQQSRVKHAYKDKPAKIV